MDWEPIFLVVLIVVIIYAVRERIRKRQPRKPKPRVMSEEEIQARILNMTPEQQRELEIQRMHYKIAPEWYLLDPALQEALLNELAPRTIVKNGKATTEGQAALFIETLRAHPRTVKIERRLTCRSERALNKDVRSFRKDTGPVRKK